MQVSVCDQLIDIPEGIIDKIPLLETLKYAQQMDKSNIHEIIKLDLISPVILKFIIDYFKNGIKTNDLGKTLYKQYDQKIVEQNLKYFGLNELYEAIYLLHHGSTIKGKIVICKIENARKSMYNEILVATLSDGRTIDLVCYRLYNYDNPFLLFEIFVDIEQLMICLTEGDAKKLGESDNIIKILDMCMMDFENYMKHDNLSYSGFLERLSKNYKSPDPSIDPSISVKHLYKKQKICSLIKEPSS